MSFIYPNNASTIGKTPLVRIQRLSKGKNILAKIEYRNPAGSVKCRIGASMVWNAEQTGRLREGMELVEPTSGNTGIALAFVAAAKGIPLTLTMPSSMSLERRQLLKTYGAKLILTEPEYGMNGAIQKAQELVDSDPERFLMLQQFDNPANPAIHEKTTGPEIWRDTDGDVDVVVAGVGTGGTLTGIARYFKRVQEKSVLCVAVEPEMSPVITQFLAGEELKPCPHKIQGIGPGFIPANLDLSVVDRVETVRCDEAIDVARQLAAKEGILCGISCGAAMAVAIRLSQLPEFDGKTFVVIMPDSGERYLSTSLFEDVFTEEDRI